MKRREMLKALPAAAVATAIPLQAIAVENPMVEIGQLAKRIGGLIPSLPAGAFDRVQIDSHGVMMSYSKHDVGGDAELFRLLQEWRSQYDVCNNSGDFYQNPDEDPEFQALLAIEEQVAAITPLTAKGFAAKLLVLTSFGQFDLDGPAECILADARAVSAFLPPATLKSPRL